MSANMLIKNYLDGHLRALEGVKTVAGKIETVAAACIDSLNNDAKIMFIGNGGSAADAQHLAAELVGRFKQNRKPLAAIALSANTSTITAVGNDFGFEEIFSRQVQGLARPGDIIFAISTSGNSKNVIRAVETAKKMDIRTIGLLGKNGGSLKPLVDIDITIADSDTPHVQEMHILIGHLICEIIEQAFTT